MKDARAHYLNFLLSSLFKFFGLIFQQNHSKIPNYEWGSKKVYFKQIGALGNIAVGALIFGQFLSIDLFRFLH